LFANMNYGCRAKELTGMRGLNYVRICLAKGERIAKRWQETCPRVTKRFHAWVEDSLAVHDLPRKHSRHSYMTNMMERVMEELRRCTRVVGISPQEVYCDRQEEAHLLEQHEIWQCEPMRDFGMEHLEQEERPLIKRTRRQAPFRWKPYDVDSCPPRLEGSKHGGDTWPIPNTTSNSPKYLYGSILTQAFRIPVSCPESLPQAGKISTTVPLFGMMLGVYSLIGQ